MLLTQPNYFKNCIQLRGRITALCVVSVLQIRNIANVAKHITFNSVSSGRYLIYSYIEKKQKTNSKFKISINNSKRLVLNESQYFVNFII